ncbi:hypothetical protein WJX72_009480 [[Myrmecia] bisecta]|uniref:Uncharacterized protein n=1 Tax=[Myrmecia] bisecta TaxID=41462 RepID=A0AAW1QG19_9CHLO
MWAQWAKADGEATDDIAPLMTFR